MSDSSKQSQYYDLVVKPLIAELRTDGFKGSGKRFYRVKDEKINLVVIQASIKSWSYGTFCVNLGAHYTFLPDSLESAPIPQKMIATSCAYNRRLSPERQRDYWWEYGDSQRKANFNAQHLIETYRVNGTRFFSDFDALEAALDSISPEHLLKEISSFPLGSGSTPVRNALSLARINLHFGRREAAVQFAQFGLSVLGCASAIGPKFQSIIDQG